MGSVPARTAMSIWDDYQIHLHPMMDAYRAIESAVDEEDEVLALVSYHMLEEEHPQSIRCLYYRLSTGFVVTHDDDGYRRLVRVLNELVEQQVIPDEWLGMEVSSES